MNGKAAITPFGLYVHWPYCTRLCPYCDFNIYRHRGGNHDDLLHAIIKDIEGHGARINAPGPLHSLSLGGGTPSLLTPAQVSALIETAGRVFGFADDPEISLEANPDALSTQKCTDFAKAGINRISIGVQSLDDRNLRFLGRDHSADEARRAVDAALQAHVRTSADFIYELPGQTPDDWSRDLDAALTLGLDHYSFYALTIAPGTAFGVQRAKGRLIPADEERAASLFELTQERTKQADLPAYEVSNHARTPAAQSRHNLVYWQNGDWVGVGPGAHGRINMNGQRHATSTALRPDDYCTAIRKTGWGVIEQSLLSGDDTAMEALSMGLRLRGGLDLGQLNSQTGFTLDQDKLRTLIADDYLHLGNQILRVRQKGWALIDALVLELVT